MKENKNMRKIKLKKIKKFKGAPLFLTNIRAGFQNLIEDTVEKRISLDKHFEITSPSTFIFHVSGDSMVDIGIYEGDLAIVKKTNDIKNNDIVIADVDGFYTIKTYRKKGDEIWLEGANSLYKKIKPKFKLEIFGKVIGITRKF